MKVAGNTVGLEWRRPLRPSARRVRRAVTMLAALVLGGAGTAAALPAAAVAEECPNAAFRTGPSALLPDCRAYELVSPSFKNAGSVGLRLLAANGSSGLLTVNAAVNGLEGFPGGGLGGTPSFYSAQRTASGWMSAPDDPPSSGYTHIGGPLGNGYEGVDADGLTTVWAERAAGQPENSISLFERLPDHSIVEVGPILPPTTEPGSAEHLSKVSNGHVRGISSDASHVVFGLTNDYWPFDSTINENKEERGNESLYEYVGTGSTTPLLIGVSDGRTVLDGRTLAAGELISRCGERLGYETEGGAGLNAMSTNGDTVFFTVYPCSNGPQVEELFARIDNGEPGARTVAISEPSEEDCSACYEGKKLVSAGQPANAYFAGASADGSKVFFTTNQALLPGAMSTSLYEYDFDAPAGEKLQLVAGEKAGAIAISQDGSHVYFVSGEVLSGASNYEGQYAQPGASNAYVDDTETGQIAFITDGEVGPSDVTPNGRFLAFESTSDLTPDDTSSGVSQIFEYDAQTGTLVRVSIGEDGYDNNGNASPVYTVPGSTNPNYIVDNAQVPSVSADGSYVFFQSTVGLTPQAANLKVINAFGEEMVVGSGQVTEYHEYEMNVYEYHDGRVSLISDGHDLGYIPTYHLQEQSVVELLGTDESGGDVFFTTSDPLVGQDTDTDVDVYDARIDGGFPAPSAPVACEGEGCLGQLSGAPTLLSPGSEFQAGGNPPLAASAPTLKPKAKTKARKCKRGAKLKRGKCVKEKKAKAGKATGHGRGRS
jgi:hypothetical protein